MSAHGKPSSAEFEEHERVEILIDSHTVERAEERGTSEDEIRDVINTGLPIAAEYGRVAKAKIYDFSEEPHGRYYQQKRVEVVYTMEGNTMITVTAYVFYGKWEEEDADSVQC